MKNVHEITKIFEQSLCDYTRAKYTLAFDNASSAIYLALCYENIRGKEITMPERTYMSAACEVINAGGYIKFEEVDGKTIKGAYQFKPTRVWDSALYFSADMYMGNTMMCVSFTGAYKTLKLSKGGAILLDDKDAYEWIKKARNSGRSELSYHDDNFTMLGKNSYLMPELSARGILLMQQFYNVDGSKKINEPVELPYPKLKDFDIYNKRSVEQQEICALYEYLDLLGGELDEISKITDYESKNIGKLILLKEKISHIRSKRIFEP